MNRKQVAVAVAVLALLIAGIACLVRNLYSDRGQEPVATVPSPDVPLLKAVPTDAALLFCFDGSRAAQRLAADSTALLGAFIDPGSDPALRNYISRATRSRTIVSLHNSGSLVPLVITALPGADSLKLAEFRSLADAAGLKTAYFPAEGMLVASRSETLVGTAGRHLSDGYSLLQNPSFADALSQSRDGNRVFICGSYAAKIYQVYAARARRPHSTMAGNLAEWAVLQLDKLSAEEVRLSGSAVTSERNYLSVFSGKSAAEPAFPEMLPATVQSVFSVVVPDLDAYLDGFTRYRDARTGHRTLDDRRVRRLEVREAAVATLQDGSRVLLFRCGNDPGGGKEIRSDSGAAELAACFGAPFQAACDTLCRTVGKWLVYGSASSLGSLSEGERLKTALSGAGISLPSVEGVVCYAAVNGTLVSSLFSEATAAPLSAYVQGTPFVPAVLSAGIASGRSALSLHLVKRALSGPAAAEAALRDTVVLVPKGPFRVKNSATGAENTFYQNEKLSICLRDENGKDQWGVPFREPLCGRVETIDYYGNGRLQYLFAAGTKLYLIDRLGRYVTGFPVDLGKEILLGPDAYDFTGAHGYRVMILHKDNTLSLYNLHGQKPEGWQDIAPAEPVKGLPEYVEGEGGKHYWLVPTASGTAVYGFYGGDPLPKKEAARVLKRTNL